MIASQLRSRRLVSLWVKSLNKCDRVKIDRRHKKLCGVINEQDKIQSCSFFRTPYFVFKGKLYKDRTLKI